MPHFRFGEDTVHIMMNDKTYGPHGPILRQQYTHNLLHNQIFPLLHEQVSLHVFYFFKFEPFFTDRDNIAFLIVAIV